MLLRLLPRRTGLSSRGDSHTSQSDGRVGSWQTACPPPPPPERSPRSWKRGRERQRPEEKERERKRKRRGREGQSEKQRKRKRWLVFSICFYPELLRTRNIELWNQLPSWPIVLLLIDMTKSVGILQQVCPYSIYRWGSTVVESEVLFRCHEINVSDNWGQNWATQTQKQTLPIFVTVLFPFFSPTQLMLLIMFFSEQQHMTSLPQTINNKQIWAIPQKTDSLSRP